MKKIAYSKSAAKTLKRIPRNVAETIIGKIEQYAADPASLANNVKAMQGKEFAGVVRLRVGEWRVLMRDGVVLTVEEIGPRGSVYE